ncbi:MAG: hypothetical protein EON58_18355 [Alphaproteobacteria bacterium]|nr:MAG: hypothetical protein EON58_18355 [Alphaproteobacteria bacterium]
MIKRLSLVGPLLLFGCDIPVQPDNVIVEPVEVNGGVAANVFGDDSLTVKLPTGEKLSVSCSAESAFVYVDTLRAAPTPPPLHGVFGTFTVDGQVLAPSELGWGGSPRSAWTLHDRNPIRPTALKIVKAHKVKFAPPAAYGGGAPIVWKLDVASADRERIVKACQ